MLLDKLPETPAPKNDLRLLYHNSESMSIHAKKARRISVDIIRQSALRKVLKNLWDCDIIILSTNLLLFVKPFFEKKSNFFDR